MHANALGAQQRLGLVTTLASVVPPLLSLLAVIAILGFGGLRILDGALTIGGLIAFQLLMVNFSRPVEGLVRFGANLQTVKGDIARLDDVLSYAPDERTRQGVEEREPDTSAPPPRGFIDLEAVTFGYNTKAPPLIEDFTLSIRPGQRVALVGGSGSGKSTIAKLVCGLLTPWSGGVRIDGQRLEDIPPSRFAEIVAHVDQEIVLFEASVRENVALLDPTVEERDVIQALRDAAVHDVVALAAPGSTTAPSTKAGAISAAGSASAWSWRVRLARNPAVLVLDEATAALDPVTELRIDDALRRRGCTCIIVAHRLSTVRDADEIVVPRTRDASFNAARMTA